MSSEPDKVLQDLLKQPFGPYLDETVLSKQCQHTSSKRLLLENLMLSYNDKPTGCASPHSLTCELSDAVALTAQNSKSHLYRQMPHICPPSNLALGSCSGAFIRSWPLRTSRTRASNISIVTLSSASWDQFRTAYRLRRSTRGLT